MSILKHRVLLTKISELLQIAFNSTNQDFSDIYHNLTGSEMIIFESAVNITKLFNDWKLGYYNNCFLLKIDKI